MSEQTKGQWHAPGNGNVVDANGKLVCPVPRPKGAGASAARDARVLNIVAAHNAADRLGLTAEQLNDGVLDRMAALVRNFEWAHRDWDDDANNYCRLCPFCGRKKSEGQHDGDCPMQALLAELPERGREGE